MFIAGVLSALLGVGGGVLKVVGLDSFMKLPFKVSTTTSNFMIGVTAAASTTIYYIGGFVNPVLAAPVAIGVVIGAFVRDQGPRSHEAGPSPVALRGGPHRDRHRDGTRGACLESG